MQDGTEVEAHYFKREYMTSEDADGHAFNAPEQPFVQVGDLWYETRAMGAF